MDALQLLAECHRMNGMGWSNELEYDVENCLNYYGLAPVDKLSDVRGEK